MSKSLTMWQERASLREWLEVWLAEQPTEVSLALVDSRLTCDVNSVITLKAIVDTGLKFDLCNEIPKEVTGTPSSTAGILTRVEREQLKALHPELPYGAYKRHYKSATEDVCCWVVDIQNGPHSWTWRIRPVEIYE